MNEPSSPDPDEAPLPEPSEVAELLAAIPGAYERAELGLRQAEAGETIPLDEL